jgi:hypothetical protein
MRCIVFGIEQMDHGFHIMKPADLLIKRNEPIPFFGIASARAAIRTKWKKPQACNAIKQRCRTLAIPIKDTISTCAILQCGSQQTNNCSDQRFSSAGNYDCGPLQITLATRVVFQLDKTTLPHKVPLGTSENAVKLHI